MSIRRIVVGGGVAALLFLGSTGLAAADQTGDPNAFLCPVIGDGAASAPGLEGETGTLPGGETTIGNPGNNQAGGHANVNGLNENGGPAVGNVPGADGFTPIWNPPNP